MKIITVLGARPQFIKASVVSHAIKGLGLFQEVIVHTGQHFDVNMSDVFFNELGIKQPNYFLGINGGGHGEMTGRMLEKLEEVMQAERPDAVIVYGDTNSTLAGALAAVKLHIPVAHVEAGLRSFNMAMPEEVNRILTDRMSRWLFTPTHTATQHLIREGVEPLAIKEVGDVMYDVAIHHGRRVDASGRLLQELNLASGTYVLATVHRAENTDHPERLQALVDGLEIVAKQMPVVWPMHPRTRGALQRMGRMDTLSPQLILIDPLGYLEMVQLEKHSAVIATDSGGVQKEAFFYQVPCVTLRDETEWVELVDAGWNKLVPPMAAMAVADAILTAVNQQGQDVKPYGAGDAAARIAQTLADSLIK
jgi:UDP-GlcNAc3NAcA epimerase